MSDKETLKHYGILGMRWGFRKRPGGGYERTGRAATDTREGDSDDHKKKVALKGKKLREMTNAEIKELTNRISLEKQYKDLTKVEISAGRKFVTDVLVTAGKQTATTYAAKYMGKAVEEVIKKSSS